MRGASLSIAELSAFNGPEPGLVAVTVRAYYDGSGQSDDAGRTNDPNISHLTLAGFCASLEAWREFERIWGELLKRESLAYLHMVEARHLRNEFKRSKGWTHTRVRDFTRSLYNECFFKLASEYKGFFVGTACTINLSDYRRACSRFSALEISKEPSAFCVDHVVTTALRLLHDGNGKPLEDRGTVELYFDKGEKFKEKIGRWWESNREVGIFRRIAKIEEADMKLVKPLQAADFLAWHANRAHSTGDKFSQLIVWSPIGLPVEDHYLDYDAIVKRYEEIERYDRNELRLGLERSQL